MSTLWLCILISILMASLFLMWRLHKQSSRIRQLEMAILGNQRTGEKLPYESIKILNSLRLQASQWAIRDTDPALLSARPVFIECLDNYLSEVFSTLPELSNNTLVEPRPLYTSLYTIHMVMMWLKCDDKTERPMRFTCASREQAECIANLLTSKGIEARWTSQQSKPDHYKI
ncbi:hypothetical protein C9426_24075 [Serratia sp. S1B]|nr:hypothetical protein C9426_24075 [Serratia sp. S1B]